MGFRKVLVANRGEIACRVMRSAAALGYRTVAVYSEADARAPHVLAADEALPIGAAPVGESYLRIDAVIAAAKRCGADAIHPGYGFLSENADFAAACAEAGITFVGPPAEAIALMGNKRAAKAAMIAAGVPCVPGFQAENPDDATLLREAEAIGFPLMVKAAAGGGGRGMRRVESLDGLANAIASARSEADSAFGSGELILERAIDDARHVEVQVMADQHGTVLHLGERDCSVQRRHQKVLEESPSPAVDEALRAKIGAAAVKAAEACNYVGAGTVELLLAADGSFYFLEMNTRLQVEHPVTELVTGLDLVALQLRVAEGERLSITQDDVTLTGHAIEARLYAEDTRAGFLPQTGPVAVWRPAKTSVARTDAGIAEGGEVSPHYDPMLAKVITHGASRDEARRKLIRALSDTTLLGVTSNRDFLVELLEHETFAAGNATTTMLADYAPPAIDPAALEQDLARAALACTVEAARGLYAENDLLAWGSGGARWSTTLLQEGDRVHTLLVDRDGSALRVRRLADDEEAGETRFTLLDASPDALVVEEGGVARRLAFARTGHTVWIDDGDRIARFDDVTHAPARSADEGSGRVAAPLDGAVLSVRVEPGDAVEPGALLVVLEAMKMEHELRAGVAGTVREVHTRPGAQVKTGQALVEIAPEGEEEAG